MGTCEDTNADECAELCFQDLRFEQREKDVKVSFLEMFYFLVEPKQLNDIGEYAIDPAKPNCIAFKANQAVADEQFSEIIESGLSKLRSKIKDKPTVYIHEGSGIPLLGNIAFGIVDRNTDTLEIKPVTGCNFDCVFCSVDLNRRTTDFLIEEAYMIAEARKVIAYKGVPVDIALNCHGDITLYKDLVLLVKDLRATPGVRKIYLITNGALLHEKLVDDLIDAGLSRFNISLHSLDPEREQYLGGAKHNVPKLIELIRYIATKSDVWITPVYVHGVNEQDMDGLIEFTKELQASSKKDIKIAIQSFLEYKMGRKLAKQLPFEEFFKKLEVWEQKHGIALMLKGLEIQPTKALPKPFKKDDIVDADIVCDSMLPNERIAVAKDRTIAVVGATKLGKARIKIISDKHNIFCGKVVR